jgi:hypothetical protein
MAVTFLDCNDTAVITIRSTNGGGRPIIHDENEVVVLGETPDTVFWQGRQWAVTKYGVEARDGTYSIAADRIAEGLYTAPYAWPEHMAEKGWVDVADFNTAWLVAIALHGAKAPKDLVRATIGRSLRSQD